MLTNKDKKEYIPNEPIISVRQVKRKYDKLINDINTNVFYKIDITNRVNCYVCVCGHITKTKDIDPGVTPFIFSCEKCGNGARSTFYIDLIPTQTPTFEWYRPNFTETLKLRKSHELLNHILSGGLNYRKIIT